MQNAPKGAIYEGLAEAVESEVINTVEHGCTKKSILSSEE
jgi:hypothetical protein